MPPLQAADRGRTCAALHLAKLPSLWEACGPGMPGPYSGYCVSSCSISSFFSGNSAAGSALKVRMPSFK